VRYPGYILPMVGCTVLLTCTGCPTPMDFAARGYSELRGAHDQELSIQDINPAELASHDSIQVDRVVSAIGNLVPGEFVVMLDASLRKELAGLKGLPGAGSPIRFIGQITYWQTMGSIEMLRGKERIAVMHVWCVTVDARTIAEFLVVATSDALRTSDLEMAQTLALGAATYFQNRMPGRR
jgi:hypothetical protein